MAHVSQYSQTHVTPKTVLKRCPAATDCYWIIELASWHDSTADHKAHFLTLSIGKLLREQRRKPTRAAPRGQKWPASATSHGPACSSSPMTAPRDNSTAQPPAATPPSSRPAAARPWALRSPLAIVAGPTRQQHRAAGAPGRAATSQAPRPVPGPALAASWAPTDQTPWLAQPRRAGAPAASGACPCVARGPPDSGGRASKSGKLV